MARSEMSGMVTRRPVSLLAARKCLPSLDAYRHITRSVSSCTPVAHLDHCDVIFRHMVRQAKSGHPQFSISSDKHHSAQEYRIKEESRAFLNVDGQRDVLHSGGYISERSHLKLFVYTF